MAGRSKTPDTWTGGEGTPNVSQSQTDTATGTEGAPSLNLTVSDLLAIVELENISQSNSDTFIFIDSDGTVANAIVSSDSITFTEGAPSLDLTTGDIVIFLDVTFNEVFDFNIETILVGLRESTEVISQGTKDNLLSIATGIRKEAQEYILSRQDSDVEYTVGKRES